MKNMNDLLRQAQVMQNKIARLQQEMAEKDVEASAGGGMVKVVMNGRQEMKSIVIDKAVMESGDNEMLQDLVMTAVNEAVRIGRANIEREMANLSGGLRIPGMFSELGEGVIPCVPFVWSAALHGVAFLRLRGLQESNLPV